MSSRASTANRSECPDCGSSRGLATYSDHTWCFVCETYTPLDGTAKHNHTEYKVSKALTELDTTSLRVAAIKDRGISEATARTYEVATRYDENNLPAAYIFGARNREGLRTGRVERHLPKDFRSYAGPTKDLDLWGAHLFPKGSAKAITVTEGREDAMAAFEMQGSKWPVVSLQNGASHAVKEFQNNLEYLESFEKVYICFDRDKPGQEAAVAAAKILSPGKAHIVPLDPALKDACGYSSQGRASEFVKAWWSAPLYTPAGILSGSQVKQRIRNREDKPSVPYPFEGLNKLTYGIRTGEAVIVTANTGVGKTAFLREIQESILVNDPDAKIGTMYLEETPVDSGLGLMSTRASIPFHLPDAVYTDEQYAEAEKILEEDRVFFYDSFGSNSIDEIISRVRYYAKGLGCKYIILDHLSIIVSDQGQGDERKALDEIMTKLKTLTIELEIALIAVVHTNRNGQIRGTAGIEQLANIVINLERDLKHENPEVRNTVHIIVAKNRFSGRTGPACLARYDNDTGRTKELDASYVLSPTEITQAFGEFGEAIEAESAA